VLELLRLCNSRAVSDWELIVFFLIFADGRSRIAELFYFRKEVMMMMKTYYLKKKCEICRTVFEKVMKL